MRMCVWPIIMKFNSARPTSAATNERARVPRRGCGFYFPPRSCLHAGKAQRYVGPLHQRCVPKRRDAMLTERNRIYLDSISKWTTAWGKIRTTSSWGHSGSLVGNGVVGRAEANFMMIGHTHILVDQVFSTQVARHLPTSALLFGCRAVLHTCLVWYTLCCKGVNVMTTCLFEGSPHP